MEHEKGISFLCFWSFVSWTGSVQWKNNQDDVSTIEDGALMDLWTTEKLEIKWKQRQITCGESLASTFPASAHLFYLERDHCINNPIEPFKPNSVTSSPRSNNTGSMVIFHFFSRSAWCFTVATHCCAHNAKSTFSAGAPTLLLFCQFHIHILCTTTEKGLWVTKGSHIKGRGGHTEGKQLYNSSC